jgi:glycine/D-amino acid oxidase-like deaminating enzyme
MRVVIIGAGVIGASVAHHLAIRGCRDLILLDRASGPGGGSTGRATGGFRAQYGTAINIRLSLLAREKLRRFAEETGGDAEYRPAGYLWLATSPDHLDELRQGLALQHREGLTESEEVTPADIRRLNPAVAAHTAVGGAFCHTDGFIRPLGILRGYLDSARRHGATVRWNTEVTGMARDASGRATAVLTRQELIEGDAFVNAGGAWAGEIGRRLGVALPVQPLRRQVALTMPTDALPEQMPMTIFVTDGFHLRVRDGRVLLLWPTPGIAGRPFDTSVDASWIDRIAEMAGTRVPPLAGVAIDRDGSWAGLYEMSPDKHAILGPMPGTPNLFAASGCSGHGVMHSPALGHLLAEIILDGRATTLDTRALRPERFDEGELNAYSEVL